MAGSFNIPILTDHRAVYSTNVTKHCLVPAPMTPTERTYPFLQHVLKDRDHAVRTLQFLVQHSAETEPELIDLLLTEILNRGWSPHPRAVVPQT